MHKAKILNEKGSIFYRECQYYVCPNKSKNTICSFQNFSLALNNYMDLANMYFANLLELGFSFF